MNMSAETLNAVDLKKIPAAVQTDLCLGALDLAIRRRSEPGYKERFEKWLAEQHKAVQEEDI